MIKAVLFDLDGVLVDACDWHYQALNEALKKYDFPEITREEHITTFNGLPTRVKLDKLGIPSSKIGQVESLKQQITHTLISSQIKKDQTKIYLMDALRDRGIKVAVVTNSIYETANIMLEGIGIRNKVDRLVTNEDVKYNKPDPDPYFYAMARLGVLSIECLIVEDSPKGIESAKKTGAYVIEVKNATEVKTELIIPRWLN